MSIFSAPSFYGTADRAIYDAGNYFIPQEQYRGAFNITPPATGTGAAAATGINTVLNQGGGGGGGIPFSGTATDLTTAFQKAVDDRQDRLNNPPSNFLGFNTMRDQELTGPDLGEFIGSGTPIPQEQTFAGKVQGFLTPQSAEDIMAEGYQEPRFQPGIISAILGSVDKYRTLSRPDQAFIAANMGYTGPTVFGENTTGGAKDPFGLNVRSGFGNYAERVGEEYASLGESLSGRLADKYGAEFDEETGMFVGPNAAKANQMTKMMRAKYNFYGQKTRERNEFREQEAQRIRDEIAAAAAAKDRAAARAAIKAQGEASYTPSIHGETDYGRDSSGRQSFDSGEGFGIGSDGGPVSNRTGRGRQGYMMGGLADLVDIYD